MFYLLRPEETLKMAVKLESVHPGRTRYLVVVSCTGRQDAEESCLLGIDCNERATVGLVLRVLADTAITLDGDGGFSVSVCGCQHIFKPVSVQAMWSALQTLHKVSSKAREHNYFLGGLSHDWVSYYEQRIESDRSCLNEWHAMDNLESRRPPSPDSVRNKPRERAETEQVIRSTLKEIMMSVDLDEVTSKYIRTRLEEDLDMDLGEFKPFIDQEMLTILGQMDAPTEIFDHVYLGSEWNASNLEELQKNGVRHILNVTREIDNFFPGMFNYLNVRVYDDEKTDLLKHWDDTFKYITKAKKEGSKVLVHCKMGVSRSASVVIAYAMKAYNWDFSQALSHVKNKRNCIKPNSSFLLQLETYQGILDAMKNKEKLQRSKSDTNLKSPTGKECAKKEEKAGDRVDDTDDSVIEQSGAELKKIGQRPKSWSPNVQITEDVLPTAPLSQSLESIDKSANPEVTREELLRGSNPKPSGLEQQESRNVLMPCDNGQSYSVSQNQVVHLPGPDTTSKINSSNSNSNSSNNKTSCRHTRGSQGQKRKGLVLNLTNQFEAASSKPSSPSSSDGEGSSGKSSQQQGVSPIVENGHADSTTELNDNQQEGNNGNYLVWTASAEVKCIYTNGRVGFEQQAQVEDDSTTVARKLKREGDPFSAQLDRVFDREEQHEPQQQTVRESPSRQSSWSSYDSAVVMDNNSMHSSWATLPSRNSSWGSYDMRPSDSLGSSGLFPYDKEEIPWHPGTVKRTKQKLEESSTTGTSKRVCTQTSEPTPAEEKITERLASAETELDNPTEPFNSVLLHFTSSPTPRRRDLPSPVSERRINVASDSHGTSSAAAPIDISPASSHQTSCSRLSTSAPAPSALSPDAELTPVSLRSCKSESETSSPCVVNTPQCPSVKHHKMVLENLCNKPIFSKRSPANLTAPVMIDDSPESEAPLRNTHGIVKNLKKEFEAKSSSKLEKSPDASSLDESCSLRQKKDVKIRSLPSSPVIPHNETKIQACESRSSAFVKRSSEPPSGSSAEDLSVRVLVGKYEVAKPEIKRTPEVQLRTPHHHHHHHHHRHHHHHNKDHPVEHPPAKAKIAPDLARRSAPMIINHHSASLYDTEAPGRPPSVPSASQVVASVVAKAASKKQQQHGRTHPLARLQVRPRHSSPVYNTM
ncbi:protein phosphatase Slingshot-like isoform X2 [Phymastichus coffea]|nr:protein phosphatase Slingshot-like isoform X2 [Phymastichus coffea]